MSGRLFNIIKPIIILFLSVYLSCFSFAPSETTSIGGSGSEIVGNVHYDDESALAKMSGYAGSSIPCANCNVYIHPKSYLADTGNTYDTVVTHTMDDGSFRISHVLPGEHLVYIKDAHGKGVAHFVTIPDESTKYELGLLKAKQNAAVRIKYIGNTTGRVLFYISVRGIGLTVGCTEGGVFAKLEDIPTGSNVEYMISIRMFYPFSKGIDIGTVKLLPGEFREFLFNELTN